MTTTPVQQEHPPLRILVVEDSDLSRELFRRALKSGPSLYAASGAKEGWRLFVEKKPDIVFVDLGLPDGDGHDLARRIKETAPECFVIIATANDCAEDRERAGLNHADGFIAKPFNKAEINDYIAHCLALRAR